MESKTYTIYSIQYPIIRHCIIIIISFTTGIYFDSIISGFITFSLFTLVSFFVFKKELSILIKGECLYYENKKIKRTDFHLKGMRNSFFYQLISFESDEWSPIIARDFLFDLFYKDDFYHFTQDIRNLTTTHHKDS